MHKLIRYSTLVLAALGIATASYAQILGGNTRSTAAAIFPEVHGVIYDANSKELISTAQISSSAHFRAPYLTSKGNSPLSSDRHNRCC